MYLIPLIPQPLLPRNAGVPASLGEGERSTGAMSLSPFTWERDGLPKRSDASRVRGNLDIKVHNTL